MFGLDPSVRQRSGTRFGIRGSDSPYDEVSATVRNHSLLTGVNRLRLTWDEIRTETPRILDVFSLFLEDLKVKLVIT